MKVLLLNGSANKNGNTFTALSEIAKQLKKNGTRWSNTGHRGYADHAHAGRQHGLAAEEDPRQRPARLSWARRVAGDELYQINDEHRGLSRILPVVRWWHRGKATVPKIQERRGCTGVLCVRPHVLILRLQRFLHHLAQMPAGTYWGFEGAAWVYRQSIQRIAQTLDRHQSCYGSRWTAKRTNSEFLRDCQGEV